MTAPFLIELEQPQAGAGVNAGEALLGYGWILAPSAVLGLTVDLDGVPVASGVTGLARADVAERHRAHPGSAHAGFTFLGRLPQDAAGVCSLTLNVQTEAGWHRHSVAVVVVVGGEAAPEALALPAAHALQIALEEARVEPGGTLHARGWAIGAGPIGSVEVYLGARSLGLAEIGLRRDDVAEAFAQYPHAATAGFALAVPLRTEPGVAVPLSVVAVDGAGESGTATLPLTFGPAAEDTVPALPAELPPMQVALEEARINEQGVLRVRGWVVSLSPIEHVRVTVGDLLLGTAQHGLPREDVGLAHADYPNAANAGFLLQIEVDDESLANQLVRVGVVALGGIRREAAAVIACAPVVRRPGRDDSTIHFHCDAVSLTEDGALYIKGWAVCESGIAGIEVDLGAERVGEAETAEERADVGNHFPHIASARRAGFRFLGRLAERRHGESVVRLTLRGHGGQNRVVLLPVLARPGEGAPPAAVAEDGGIRFFLDSPGVAAGHAVEPVRGFLSLSGWAFSSAGVSAIEVFVDGRSLGEAYRGIRREDLHAIFGRPEALRCGFAMLIPPQIMKRGRHDVRVDIRDKAGQVEEIAFSLDAEPSLQGAGPWALRRKLPLAEIDLQRAVIDASGQRPQYRLLLPLGRLPLAALRRARATLESLRHQAYPDWRLVVPVANDAQREALEKGLLPGFEDLLPHIDLPMAWPATRLADLLTGREPRWLCLLAPGDLLGEDALLEFAVAGATGGQPDFLYADERRLDPSDATMRAFFKPDWSPDLMLSTNYVGHPWVAGAAVLDRAGVLLGDIERHGEYDLALRLTERAARIVHVARVLCERGARSLDAPSTERRALQRALARRGIRAEVANGCLPGSFQIRRGVEADALVSIIIPTIAARGLVKVAVESIRALTGSPRFEIVVLDTIAPDADPAGLAWKAWLRAHADRVVEVAGPFNWSRLNNLGAASARGEFLLFLNDDVEVTDGAWLSGLVAQAQRPEIGVVGPQLLYPDGKVQHAGMFLSGHVGRHAFRFSPRDAPGPFGLALTQRDVISVTGACLMTRRDVFDAVGGFDERHAVVNNDLDFCLRVRRAGRSVIYTPHVSLTHHEMVSRGAMRDVFDAPHFAQAWQQQLLAGDPFFNRNLALDVEDYVPEEEPTTLLHVGHPVMPREAVRRIVALKLDHIGDFVAAFPAFRRLKQRFPQAELTVVAARASLSLAALEPAIDRIIHFDFFHARSERGRRPLARREVQALADQLAPSRFDLALDLRRQPDTRDMLRHTGARWLAGFDQGNHIPWLDIAVEWEGDVARTHKRTHVSDALVQFVDAVAVACETERRMIAAPPPAAGSRRALLALPEIAALGPSVFDRPLVCLHAGAGSENKRWPLPSFASLVDLLVAQDGVGVVVIGGADETPLVEELLGLVRDPSRVVSLVGKLGLQSLPLLLPACALYVGNDSGPKHIAAALGVPTLGIHAGAVDATEWGPLGPAAIGIRRATTCSPCYLAKVSDCHRGLACLTGIGVGDVHLACRRLLALSRHPAAPGEPRAPAPAEARALGEPAEA